MSPLSCWPQETRTKHHDSIQRSFTSHDTIGNYRPAKREQIEFALAEGWHWLVQEGLIAPKPGDTYGWHFITRRGKKIKNREGLSAYRSSVCCPD